jgi:nitroreductase
MTDTRSAPARSVTDALRLRRSVRSFTAEPVPDLVLDRILSTALLSPSGGNLQPWHVHAVVGAPLERLKQRMRGYAESGFLEEPGHDVYPASLWDPYRSRRYENGEMMYATIGIGRDNKPARLQQLARNYQFFGAPVGLFFAIERRMKESQWIDLGILMQSVMLLAIEQGLATCPQAAWVNWPDTLRELLGVPDEMIVVAGMALGYEDIDHPINGLRTTRQSFAEGVTFHRG